MYHPKFPRMWQEHFFIFTLSSKERGIAWQLDIIIIIFCCLPSCCFSLLYANHEEEGGFLTHTYTTYKKTADFKVDLQTWFWRMQMKEKWMVFYLGRIDKKKSLLFSNFLEVWDMWPSKLCITFFDTFLER